MVGVLGSPKGMQHILPAETPGNSQMPKLDAEYREKVIEPYRKYQRELRFKADLYQLRNHPELQATLRAIRLYKTKGKKISALKIRGEMYEKRLFRVREILKIST